ncbi:hypothetical protein FQB35_09125 [Crassaminicella thermophila]|uniref:Uncharacterized protein n=1 Tax=Crassaminicella thermophila TaxID=2599308 RepID=A0A5C0SD67_CRATE|nr:hypothetical protein [Crassaminicella thermophila]QEK12475.1 hypothetical protein FQB35_09125 [Crassaminicella thermophila]
MTIFSSRLLRHKFCIEELKKIGAEVMEIEGIMFIVKYHKDNLHIEYLYHINPDNSYLLERIKPYSLVIDEYLTEEDVITAIQNDLDQFKNARKSKNFNDFVSIDKNLTKIVRYFEDLYLYYNIDKNDIAFLKKEVNNMVNAIMEIKNRSKRVYHKTEPQSFK